jgi:hypothetical protein
MTAHAPPALPSLLLPPPSLHGPSVGSSDRPSYLPMTTAFRNWLSSASLFNTAPDDTSSEIVVQEPVDDAVDSGEDTAKEDDDRPPAFPAMNSAQRASSSPSAPPVVSIPAIVSVAPPAGSTDATLLIPPMPGRIGQRIPGVAPTNTKAKPSANTLMLPPSTTKPSTKAKKGEKVALAPGFGPLDWAALKTSGADLRVRVTSAQGRSVSPFTYELLGHWVSRSSPHHRRRAETTSHSG